MAGSEEPLPSKIRPATRSTFFFKPTLICLLPLYLFHFLPLHIPSFNHYQIQFHIHTVDDFLFSIYYVHPGSQLSLYTSVQTFASQVREALFNMLGACDVFLERLLAEVAPENRVFQK